MIEKFYFAKTFEVLRSEKDLTGKDGVLTPCIKQLVE